MNSAYSENDAKAAFYASLRAAQAKRRKMIVETQLEYAARQDQVLELLRRPRSERPFQLCSCGGLYGKHHRGWFHVKHLSSQCRG